MLRRGVLATAFAALLAAMPTAAPAHHVEPGDPDYPSIARCSSGQRAELRAAWKRGHRMTSRAEGFLRHIGTRPAEQAEALWTQDFAGYGDDGKGDTTGSPQRYFGAYDAGRAGRIREALTTARRRFEGKTIYVLECAGTCPKISAHHIVVGRIVTCPRFWDVAGPRDRSRILVHEVLHHVTMKVGGVTRYVEDHHGDGAGGHPDRKYYGIENVTYLARHAPGWAMRNNDSYAFFANHLDQLWEVSPRFTAVFGPKEGTGTGALFADLTWGGLIARRDQLAAQGQYLADVETYLRHGARRYAAVWRIGDRDGGFYAEDAGTFLANWSARKGVQDLIDVELYVDGGERRMIGVYRGRAPGASGDGGLFIDMTWDQLVARQQAFAGAAYLADVETYLHGGTRRYAGVWRVGRGTGGLLRTNDGERFRELSDELAETQHLIDHERYTDARGHWQLGVWRVAGDHVAEHGADPDGVSEVSSSGWDDLVELWTSWWDDATLIDLDDASMAAMES